MADYIEDFLEDLTDAELCDVATRIRARLVRSVGRPRKRSKTPYHVACVMAAMRILREENRWAWRAENAVARAKLATRQSAKSIDSSKGRRLPKMLLPRMQKTMLNDLIEAEIQNSAALRERYFPEKNGKSPADAIENHVKRRIRRLGPAEPDAKEQFSE